jgi:hypothetical protein
MGVAERLLADKASQFTSLLCELGDVILFSAAIPGQGGCNHINEAWPAQWADTSRSTSSSVSTLLRSRMEESGRGLVVCTKVICFLHVLNRRPTPGCIILPQL